MIINNNKEIYIFKHLLYACYTKDSCYHTVKDKWTDECKELGQDTITSILIKDNFGGLIKRIYVEDCDYYHFYNVVDKKILDFTKTQFPKEVTLNYENGQTKSRAKLLDIVDLKNRYEAISDMIKHKSYELDCLINEMNNEKINFSLYLNEDCKFFIVAHDYIEVSQIESNPNLTESEKRYLIDNAVKISYILLDDNPKNDYYINRLKEILNPYKIIMLN